MHLILFLKDMGLSLTQIKAIIDDPAYDRAAAIKMQIEHLEREKEKIEEKLMLLRSAVSETEDIFNSPYETIWNCLEQNAKEYPALFSNKEMNYSAKILNSMPDDLKQDIADAMQEHMLKLAGLVGEEPSSSKVQKAIKQYHDFLNKTHGGIYTLDRFAKLGEYYISSETFRIHLEEIKKGLSEFIKEAILNYVKKSLNN
jgi:DNA-binding transcriptional MerR regulator